MLPPYLPCQETACISQTFDPLSNSSSTGKVSVICFACRLTHESRVGPPPGVRAQQFIWTYSGLGLLAGCQHLCSAVCTSSWLTSFKGSFAIPFGAQISLPSQITVIYCNHFNAGANAAPSLLKRSVSGILIAIHPIIIIITPVEGLPSHCILGRMFWLTVVEHPRPSCSFMSARKKSRLKQYSFK